MPRKAIVAFALTAATGCSNRQDLGNLPSCNTASDCASGSVCVSTGSQAVCTPTCSGSANECSGSATCAGVASLAINVCQEPPSAEDPPEADEQPRIPCATDAECAAVYAGAICAQYQGVRDCTIACTSESSCDTPSVGGVTVDFAACMTDEGTPSRQACLPDPACLNNPLSCIDGFPSFDAGIPEVDGGVPDPDSGNTSACDWDEDCAGGYACNLDDQCYTSCDHDADCKLDYDCSDSVCIPSEF